MNLDWIGSGPVMLAAFLASLVECLEALAIILAVGTVRGWRGALAGTAGALLLLLVAVTLLGRALYTVSLALIQILVGGLLLLFGMRWLRKAVLRSAGVISRHNHAAAYAKESSRLTRLGSTVPLWDPIAFVVSFKITVLEGIEVVFVVIAISAADQSLLLPASVGAVAAMLVIVCLGLILRRPITSIPENQIKFAVGVLLSTFGTSWFGEGLGIAWPWRHWSLLALIGGFTGVALLTIRMCHIFTAVQTDSSTGNTLQLSRPRKFASKVLAPFGNELGFAVMVVAWLAVAYAVLPQAGASASCRCGILFGGLVLILAGSALGRALGRLGPEYGHRE
jgi:Ca2+/H+ antiporter, TMEM165/GDT1 family